VSAALGQRAPAPIELRHPAVSDGAALWQLVKEGGVLDLNSSYMYLLLCDRFAETTILAEKDGELAGFVLGLIPPEAPDVVFVWQIGVASFARGQGLARALLERLMAAPACRRVRYLETTVTPSNEASIATFRSFARHAGAPMIRSEGGGYDGSLFPDGKETEVLYRIGPFAKRAPHPGGAS
jgi:diaminobutyrate acetyltransferase